MRDLAGRTAPVSRDGAPLIVSAIFAAAEQAWLDGLRRRHYPAALNRLPAHLTLFRHLPPSIEAALRRRLAEAVRSPVPMVEAAGLMSLGSGVAIRIVSPALSAIREDLAEAFAGLLMPQDSAGWRPHVTIQNKVQPAAARALLEGLDRDFRPRRMGLTGLASWRYRDGLWEPVSRHAFA